MNKAEKQELLELRAKQAERRRKQREYFKKWLDNGNRDAWNAKRREAYRAKVKAEKEQAK